MQGKTRSLLLLVLCGTSLLATAHAQEGEAELSPAEQIRKNLQIAADPSKEMYERTSALDNIGYMGAQAQEAIPALLDYLENDNDSLANSAQMALGYLVQDAKPLLPSFQATLAKQPGPRTILFIVEKLGSVGEDAQAFVPQLTQLLTHKTPEVRRAAAQVLGNQGNAAAGAISTLMGLLDDEDDETALNASMALHSLIQKPETLVPVFVTAYQDTAKPKGRLYAAQNLTRAGVASKPALDALLKGFQAAGESAELRTATAEALGAIGEEAAPAVPALIAALDDENDETALNASMALHSIVQKADRFVPVLMTAYQDTAKPKGRLYSAQRLTSAQKAAEPAVALLLATYEKTSEAPELRIASAEALGAIGPAAGPAVRALIRGLGESGSDVSLVSSIALHSINVDPAPHFEVLLDALQDQGNVPGRIYASDQLGRLGAGAAKAVSALLEAMQKGGDPKLRASAASTLGRIGPPAEPAVAALLTALNSDESEFALNAGIALRAIIVQPLRVLPVLLEFLKDQTNRPAWIFCAGQIQSIGVEARAAVPFLIAGLPDRDSEPRRIAAADALGSIGPDAAAAVRPLIAALDDPLPSVGSAAQAALASIVPRPEKVLDVLLEAVQDTANEPGRVWVVTQLGKVGVLAAPARADLENCLGSRLPELRRVAAETLGFIGPKAQPAMPALFALLDEEDTQVASQARASLANIVAQPAEFLPLLLPAVPDASKPNTQLYAVETLVQIGPKAREAVPDLVTLAGQTKGVLHEATLKALGAVAPLKLVEVTSADAAWYDAHYVDWIAVPMATLAQSEQFAEIAEALGPLASSRNFQVAPGWIQALAYYDVALGYLGKRDSQQGLSWFVKAAEQGYDDVANIHDQSVLRVLFDAEALRGAYSKIQVVDADQFELGWMTSELLAVRHETSILILENIGREDPDFTEVPQVVLPLRETKSPTVKALRQLLRKELDRQKEIVFLSDKSRIQHQTSMLIISNMGSVTYNTAERAMRIQLSRKRASDNAASRRSRVEARQKVLAAGTTSTQPHAAPELGTYRKPT